MAKLLEKFSSYEAENLRGRGDCEAHNMAKNMVFFKYNFNQQYRVS
jgi:hypothetical protein